MDGLPDRQEVVLGTSPFLADTDFDGYTDGEEFALQTSPIDFNESPGGTRLSVGMSARGEGNELKLFVAIFDPDGNIKNNSLHFGLLMGGRLFSLNVDRALSVTTGEATSQYGGNLFLMDFVVPTSSFRVYDELTYCIGVGRVDGVHYACADKVDLFLKNGIVTLRDIVKNPGDGLDPNMAQIPGTTVHHPIPPQGDGGIPVDWEPGQVCYQETQVVGTSGAVVQHEVVSAECVEGWDTYCASDCAGTVGSTYQTVDTGVLLGG